MMQKTHRRLPEEARSHILVDIGFITLSVLLSFVLIKTQTLRDILASTRELELISTLVAGMFFTSVFTTAPAIATLGEIALAQSVFTTALVGAIGSVAGDLIIFRFVKERVSGDVIEVLKYEGVLKRTRAIFRLRFFRWFTFLLGGLIIASPLPDELGIALLGFSNLKTSWFFWLSLFFNFLGILGICIAARTLMGIPV